MIAGRPPFRGLSEFLIFQKISSVKFQYPKGFPDVAKDLINKLLVADPDKRLGATGYKDLKSHPFFKDIDFDKLHTTAPPPIQAYPNKLVFEEDVVAEEEAKRKKMQEEEADKW
jgi:3-phosphoinositide dependent protein kinase-1